MSAVGGPIEEITLAGRVFAVAADVESDRKIGGRENGVQANGNGTGRLIQTTMPWKIGGLTVEIDDSRNDQEFLQDLADASDFFSIAVTYASGVTYQGVGQIVEEMQASSKNATASITLSGPGKLTQQ